MAVTEGRGWLESLVGMGDRAGDTPAHRVDNHYLVYLSLVLCAGGGAWSVLCVTLGELALAGLPLLFLGFTAANLYRFHRGADFHPTLLIQVWAGLVLPFAFQWGAGGIIATGGVMLWAIPSITASLRLDDDRQVSRVLVAFFALATLSGVLDLTGVLQRDPIMDPTWLPLLFVANTCGIAAGLAGLTMWFTREQERLRREVQAMDDLKSEFLSTVSHELRTPLTSILGFTEMIRKKLEKNVIPAMPEDEKRAKKALTQIRGNLRIMTTEGRRLTDLINNVLDLHKMEAGLMEWEIEPIDISEVIDHAGAACSILFMDKPGVHYAQNIGDELPAIEGDAQRLIQVVINLVSNAIKFTEEGSVQLTVEPYRDPGGAVGVQVCVADTGPGIAADHLDDVFDHFRQVGQTEEKINGSGLGLSITRKIVDSHGGRIWVESQLGRGSRFTFRIPSNAAGSVS